MILDIVQIIVNYSILKNQIVCLQINSYTYNNLYVYSLENIPNIDQKIIEKKMFCRLHNLNCFNNNKINNVDHLVNTLEILNCGGDCGIDQTHISKLKNIKELHCSDNNKINNVNHLANTLEILSCESSTPLNLLAKILFDSVIRYASGDHLLLSSKIPNEPFYGTSRIDQEGISRLKHIKKLYCRNNKNINNVNHLKQTLKVLDCSLNCGIGQEGISQLLYIKKLNCIGNKKINDASHLKQTLDVSNCEIDTTNIP